MIEIWNPNSSDKFGIHYYLESGIHGDESRQSWIPLHETKKLNQFFLLTQAKSKLSYLGEPRENARARSRGKESLQRSLINFHFHPGNPGTLQSVKTVSANVPQIRKVTAACQV